MFIIKNKSIVLALSFLVIISCSNEFKLVQEECQKAIAPPEKSFDDLTLKTLNDAYDKLILSCDNNQISKVKSAYNFANLAKLYLVNDMNDAAYQSFQSALSLYPKHFDWHYLSGISQERIGNLNAAIQQFIVASSLNSRNIPNLIRLAENQKLLNKIVDTEKTLEKIFLISPNQSIATQLKGQMLIEKEKYYEAELLLKHLIENHPEANKLNYILSNALRNQGKIEESAIVLKSAGTKALLLKDPILESLQKLVTGAGGFIILANKARKTGDLSVAKTHLLTAIKYEPNNVSALHNLGYIFGVEGDHFSAMQYLKKAMEANPNNIDIASDYASSLVALQKYKEAIVIYNGILEISPNDKEAISRKNKIELFLNSKN